MWTIAIGVCVGILAAIGVILILGWLLGTREGQQTLRFLVLLGFAGCLFLAYQIGTRTNREEAAAAAAEPNPPDWQSHKTSRKTSYDYERDLAAWDSAHHYVRVRATDECRRLRDSATSTDVTYSLPGGSVVQPGTSSAISPASRAMRWIKGDAPLAVYRGGAYNTTAAIQGDVRLTVCNWSGPTSGYFRVFPPLAGSGTFYPQSRGDSTIIATTSDGGDRILWFAARQGEVLVGTYRIVGGQFVGQQGPAGSHTISGSWRFTKIESLSDNSILVTFKVEGGSLAMTSPTGQSYSAKLDGTEAPYRGDPGTTSVSVKQMGKNTIDETDKRDGKVISVTRMTVAPDGKSLTFAVTDKLHGTTSQFVAEKQ